MREVEYNPQPECPHCGGLHYGSFGCPYSDTVCDQCHKTLLQHVGQCFCEGGKTEHNPRQKYCTCEKCVSERMAMTKKKMTKQDREIEKLQQWKRTVENAFTAGMLGMEHGSLMGGTKLTAHGFITSLRVAMRQAEDEFMGRTK
jgi:hypothetical protein